MADIPYLNDGRKLLASDWDTLIQEANARLLTAYNGRCPFLWDATAGPVVSGLSLGVTSKRKFFFCDSADPSTPYTSLAQQAIADYQDWNGVLIGLQDFSGNWKRAYEHDAFQTWVNGATLGSVDPRPVSDTSVPVVRLQAMSDGDWTTLKAALWPVTPAYWWADKYNFLDYSLEAHKRIIDDVPCFVYIDPDSPLPRDNTAEFLHWWDQAEIILGEGFGDTFTWPDNYDKYRLLRFHNLQAFDTVITFHNLDADGAHAGGLILTIPAMGSLCVRAALIRPELHWVRGYDYFHKPLSLDPWFATRDLNCNITDPTSAAGLLPYITGTLPGSVDNRNNAVRFDPAKWLNTRGSYFGPPLSSTGPPCFPPPEGQWFGDGEDDDTPLGDLVFHRGKLVVIRDSGPWVVQRDPAQSVTLIEPTQIVTLRKADNTIALGVEDFTVTRQSDSASIPAGSGADTNWVLTDEGDHFEVQFSTRAGGASPRLAIDDVLLLDFKHLTDDQKFIVHFKGMATLASQLAKVGITVTDPDPDHAHQILISSGEDDLDLYGLSSNLVLAGFGQPGVNLLEGGVSLPPFYLPCWIFKAARTTTNIATTYKTFDLGTPGDYSTVEFVDNEDVDVDSQTYELSHTYSPDPLSLSDTLGDLYSALLAIDRGVLTLELDFKSTPFGPAILASQSGDLRYPFNQSDVTYGDGGAGGKLDVSDDGLSFTWSYIGLLSSQHGGSSNFMNLLDDRNGTGPLGVPPFNAGTPPYNGWPTFWFGHLFSFYPRVERAWSNYRYTPKPDVMDDPSVLYQQAALVKTYYENEGFNENGLKPLTTDPSEGGVGIKRGVAILQQWTRGIAFDIWMRFAAWVNYAIVRFNTATGIDSYDFGRESALQAAYFSANRGDLYTNAYHDEDEVVKNVLPIQVENYNTLAAAINGTVAKIGGKFRSPAQLSFLDYLTANIGRGLGNCNYRPRTQWISWNDDDVIGFLGITITEFFENLGVPIKTSADFPSEFADFLAGDVTWFTAPGLTTDYGSGTTPLTDKWFPYHEIGDEDVRTDDGHGYRWITIEDAQALYDSLGLEFIMQELVCPASLVISVGDPSLVLAGEYTTPTGPVVATVVQWVNDDEGDWVYTPENDTIRADVSRVDYPIVSVWGSGISSPGIYDINFSADVCTRIYQLGSLPVAATQAIVANRYFIWRRYGCAPAKSVVWPRNYVDYSRDTGHDQGQAAARVILDSNGFNYIERIPVDSLEPVDDDDDTHFPEVNDLTEDENPITTEFENAKLVIWKGLSSLV